MRTVDERVAAVRNRSVRLRRKRCDGLLSAVVCLMLLPVVGLAVSLAIGSLPAPQGSGAGLFGTSSLFGSSVGGYVLVAVLAAVVAVAVTVLLTMRRRAHGEKRNGSEAAPPSPAETDSQGR